MVKLVSIIISVFNEEETLEPFHTELKQQIASLNYNFEIIFVNDGSIDSSSNKLDKIAKKDSDVKIIHLSRNFGHEAAMIAGIDHSSGKAIICMDADLQHPPSEIKNMLSAWKQDSKVVTMIREKNQSLSFLSSLFSTWFYKFINLIAPVNFVPNASDFFLVSKEVVKILRKDFRERSRFLRGFVQLVGFRKSSLYYTAPKRAFGESKYNLLKLSAFAFETITSFSRLPLRIGLIFGVIVAIFSLVLAMFSILMKILGYTIPGYTTIVVSLSFFFAVHFILIGLIGEYVGQLFDEVKKRPIYIIEKTVNLKTSDNH